MKFSRELTDGIFLKRYKRFFADVEVGGQIIVAHVPNSGSMKGAAEPMRPCRITLHNDPKRKLKATLEMVKMPSSWVGVNTSHPNLLAWEAWESKLLPHWKNYARSQREVKISDHSRIDLVLWNPVAPTEANEPLKFQTIYANPKQKYHFVEVKNVSLADGDLALFPDSVTERGQKHLTELMELMAKGHTCEMLYVVQREDIFKFAPADLIDAKYGELLRAAQSEGLKITALRCALSKTGISLNPKALSLEF